LASAIALCATHADAAGETFLVSDNQDISTPDLIRLISASMGQMPNIWKVPLGVLRLAGLLTGKSAAINRLTGSLVVNSRKIRVNLGWEPPVTLADGLQDAATRYLKSGAGK
jgi:nucleoside-diphosphate-sugar epimerase